MWSPTTIRNLTSIVECHLKPCLGDILVATSRRLSWMRSTKACALGVESMEALRRSARYDVSTLRSTRLALPLKGCHVVNDGQERPIESLALVARQAAQEACLQLLD